MNTMFATLKALISKWLQPATGSAPAKDARISSTVVASQEVDAEPRNHLSDSDKGRTFSDLVLYDEHLLERSRTQWQFGDWDSLADIDREALQHHPDRAKLALMVAAGKMQKNQMPEAQQFMRLAQDWGVSRKLLTQILAAGVHNSLACASFLAGRVDRATQHFESAMALGASSSDQKLLLKARMDRQVTQLGFKSDMMTEPTTQEIGSAHRLVTQSTQVVPSLSPILMQQREYIEAQFKRQSDEVATMRKHLQSSLQKEVANAAKQIEATLSIQNYFATGDLLSVNTEQHGWPISPDFAVYVIELIEKNDYDIIVEFGSGVSTLIVAKTLAKLGNRREGRMPVEFIAFEHLEKYLQKTQGELQHAGLDNTVDLRFSPLQEWKSSDGMVQPYYDCEIAFENIAQKHTTSTCKLLAIVDGPPGGTFKHARYPAVPILLKYFKDMKHLDILLDDYVRIEEREIVDRWKIDIKNVNLSQVTDIKSLEKGACLIHIQNNS